jgi:hypothetical protein
MESKWRSRSFLLLNRFEQPSSRQANRVSPDALMEFSPGDCDMGVVRSEARLSVSAGGILSNPIVEPEAGKVQLVWLGHDEKPVLEGIDVNSDIKCLFMSRDDNEALCFRA